MAISRAGRWAIVTDGTLGAAHTTPRGEGPQGVVWAAPSGERGVAKSVSGNKC